MRETSFSFFRFGRLLLLDIRLFWVRQMLDSVVPLLVIAPVLAYYRDGGALPAWYGGLCGVEFMSRIFLDLHHPLTAQTFLLLPASIEEKFISRYFLSIVGFVLIFFIGYQWAEGVNAFLRKPTNPPSDTLILFFFLMCTHSLSFAGAVYFRKYSFTKTILMMYAFFFLLVSIVGVTSDLYHDKASDILLIVWFIFVFGVMPVCALAFAYFRLRETEV